MTIIRCKRRNCLNRGTEVCTANRIDMDETGKCTAYITAEQATRASYDRVERRNGAIVEKHRGVLK